jgi:hypothetical protein
VYVTLSRQYLLTVYYRHAMQNEERTKKQRTTIFVTADQWPPYSPDVNPLDYYFWNRLKNVVYGERVGKGSFESLGELQSSIRRNWNRAIDMDEVHKALNQFLPRCRKVAEVRGEPIKAFFG